ncbi:alkaline phosphatase PhoY [soil metagenome]
MSKFVSTALAALALLATLPAPRTAMASQAVAQTAPTDSPDPQVPAPPTLVVTIVVDQLSANLFNQYRSRFTGGLRTLADQGLVYTNGYQAQGVTTTCPGHSTILSGDFPTHTGIPANEWLDPATSKTVYCLVAPNNTIADGSKGENGPVGPEALRVSTLGDWLKASSPQSRVYAVSGKDRGAINLAGHTPDGAFWFSEGFGMTTYLEPGQTASDRLASIAEFNIALAARFAADGPPTWTYRHDACRAMAGQSIVAGEVFHADLPPEAYTMEDSPVLDETTLAAATDLLERQKLGQRGVTDMLGVALSGTDKVGHGYGTQGPEMCEQLLRLDEALGGFLEKVRHDVPGALIVLTADHGGSDYPERMTERGAEAGRYDPAMLPRVNAALMRRFNLPVAPLKSGGTGFVVIEDGLPTPGEAFRQQIVSAAVELLNQEPQIILAVARDTLLTDPMPAADASPEELTVRERLRLSAVEGRGADILRAYKPFLIGDGTVGSSLATHGSPWDYDRRVPIIFWRADAAAAGPVRPQERFWPIRTVDIAPSLANIMRVAVPDARDGHCLNLGLYDVPVCRPVAP